MKKISRCILFENTKFLFVKILITIFLILNLISQIVTTNNLQQAIVEEPDDQQVSIGDQVILKCKINNLRGEPQWCIDDFCLGFSANKNTEEKSIGQDQFILKGRPRHKIIGDKTKGEFHLLIEPVQLQDNMFYYCMATAATGNVKAIKSKKVFLTVLSKLLC